MHHDLESENLRWLGAFPQLVAITDPAWRSVVEEARPVSIAADTALTRNGGPCQKFLLLYRGVVRVEEASAKGREIVLYRVHPGEICILAIHSLMGNAPFAARAVAETPVQGLSLTLEQFERALAQSKGFRRFILTTMAKRLHEVMRLVQEVAFHRLDTRLATTLYELFHRKRNDSVRITHQQLATELGSTREVVSRLLKDFEEETGCIRLHRGRIELLSRSELESRAQRHALAS